MVASGVSVLAVLAIVAQVSAYPMGCNEYVPAVSSCGPAVQTVAYPALSATETGYLPAVQQAIETTYVPTSFESAASYVPATFESSAAYIPGSESSAAYVPAVASLESSSAYVPAVASFESSSAYVPAIASFESSNQGVAQVQDRVSQGTYRVALDNNGPSSSSTRIPVIRTQVTAPVREKPTVRIPAQIPAPRTISNQCRCVKTVVKPQVIEQLVTVPSIQRYIQTTSRPVVERIHYNAVPVNNNVEAYESAESYGVAGAYELSGSFGSGSYELGGSPVQLAVSSPVAIASPLSENACSCY